MSDDLRKGALATKMLIASYTVRDLLSKISALETNQELSLNEKLEQIKIIKDEITKVGTEIDSIKREIKLLSEYSIN
jgi:hypothetical protein